MRAPDDVENDLDRLEDEVAELRGTVEKQAQQIRDLEQRQAELASRVQLYLMKGDKDGRPDRQG